MTHICVSKLTIIDSDNGLSPGRRQAIIWTHAGILLIWPLEINFSEISIDIHAISLKKIHFKMSSAKWRPFCLGLNVLRIMVMSYLLAIYGGILSQFTLNSNLVNERDDIHWCNRFQTKMWRYMYILQKSYNTLGVLYRFQLIVSSIAFHMCLLSNSVFFVFFFSKTSDNS